ncbi:class I adenylate-forming enzyme family protein [Paraburkholderia sp. D1E]|uniref:class I adenylate-forming enzyme family protein n=1 Tax=Paraburkholderia sp. D1E TaxID=3461398 RepID=UPI0040467984
MNAPRNDARMITTVGAALADATDRYPNHVFLSDGTRDLTFQETSDQVDGICRALLERGLQRGDRLALLLPNSPEWVLLMLGCARLGIMVITVNTRGKAEEVAYVLAKSRAKALVMVDSYWNIDYRASLAGASPSLFDAGAGTGLSTALSHLEQVIVLDGAASDFGLMRSVNSAQVSHDALARAQAAVLPDDPAITVFTSGTTGKPKGAVHSHVFLRNASNFARGMRMAPGDVILGHMPFFHVAGLVTALFPALLTGCALVTMNQWQPQAAARLIAERRIRFFGGIPTHFIDLAEIVERERLDTSCLKAAWIGGANVSTEVALRAMRVLRLEALLAAYGMTETSGCTTLTRYDDPVEVACEGKGMPIGDYEVQVVDPKTRALRLTGETGEIWVRGEIVMNGYLEDPEETAEVMTEDGWFRTGDLGQLDPQGYLRITGRLKDMFIVGGNNVYPAEVERCLHFMPGVRQVAVVGVPDVRLGEVGYAFVERDGATGVTREQIVSFAKRHLADYKVPRHVAFVDAFPMTGARKVQRHALVADAIERLKDK